MTVIENKNMEFKREYVTDIRKEVVAFANLDGGAVLIGVEDDGTVCGLGDSDMVANQLANSLKDAIVPDVMPFVDIEKIERSPAAFPMRKRGVKAGGV